MNPTHDVLVERQFGVQADAYVQSSVHAAGKDLDMLEAIVRRAVPHQALDLGAGGGHVSYRLAPHVAAVTASDLSQDMLDAIGRTASQRNITNLQTRLAPAERLSFEDGQFDFLACRFSTHHWDKMEIGLSEARRVLARGSSAVFIDVVSPGPGALDTHLQAVELLRDVSHVRDYTIPEWQAALTRAGFALQALSTFRLRLDYSTWVERMNTPEPHRAAIRSLQRATSEQVARHFAIEPDGSFTIDTALFELIAD